MMVKTGTNAFRNPWFSSACLRLKPFARAVRIKSSVITSSRARRMTRVRIAACGKARAMAGRVRLAIPRQTLMMLIRPPTSQPSKPPAGNTPKVMAKTKTNMMANQKLGMAMPICAPPRMIFENMLLGLRAVIMATEKADRTAIIKANIAKGREVAKRSKMMGVIAPR